MSRSKKVFNRLWRGAVNQLEDVGKNLAGRGRRAGTQVAAEMAKLGQERNKLLVRLGEQTLSWINASPVPVPEVVRSTVTKLNGVLETLRQDERILAAAQGSMGPSLAAKQTPRAADTAARAKTSPKTAKKARRAKETPKATPRTTTEAKTPTKSAKPKETSAPNKAPVARKRLG